MENHRETSPKHQQTKQKWKNICSCITEREKAKNRKTSKDKLSLAKIVEEISAKRDIPSDSHSQPTELNQEQPEQQQNKEKFIKATRKLMKLTLVEKNLNRSKGDPNENDGSSSDNPMVEEEPLVLTEAEQKNVQLMEKLTEYSRSDLFNTMDFSSLNVTDDDIPVIFKMIYRGRKRSYRNLILRDNALTSIGVRNLVDGLLKRPTNLRNIGLSSNPEIGDEGIEHLIRLLREDRSVTILALHHTGITDQGIRLLAQVLCDTDGNSFSPLEKLYISFNKGITDESLETLVQILEENHTLKVVGLQHCSLSERARRRLRYVVAKKKKRRFSFAE